MAFEDDMIDAGYSDEQEYLDSLVDDFEKSYSNKNDMAFQYDNEYYDSDFYEERKKENLKRESEKEWISEWKLENPNIAIIWEAYFRTCVESADFSDYSRPNEYNILKIWLQKRNRFEIERAKDEWALNLHKLFSLYKNELYNYYFPEDIDYVNMEIISQQAQELYSIKNGEPLLWKHVLSHYEIAPKLTENIIEEAFWNEVYNDELVYDFWIDNNVEQFDLYTKRWIADSDYFVYGEWQKNNKIEEYEWKKEYEDLWHKVKQNFMTREKNKCIISKIEANNNNIPEEEEDDFLDEEFSCFATGETYRICNPFLPDLEVKEEHLFDGSKLRPEQRNSIEEAIYSLDMNTLEIESTNYADKVLTQMWLYINRNKWAIKGLKERHEDLLRYGYKYSDSFLNWWKEKYNRQWNEFKQTTAIKFKNDFEIVMKFRLWASDGHKEDFIALSDKFLRFWKKTLALIYGQDVLEQLKSYFYNLINHPAKFWGEDIDYINLCVEEEYVEIWQKEMRDEILWKVLYNKEYREHYFIEYIYKSLKIQ